MCSYAACVCSGPTGSCCVGCRHGKRQGNLPQAAQEASSSSGGDPAPGWSAADALQQVASTRAHQWRQQEGLLDDNDFAFAFTDYDHCMRIAGHHVADCCLSIRSDAEQGLLAAGARVIEHPNGPVSFTPVRKTISKRKGRTVSIRPKTDEATQKRIRTLVSLFMGLGSFKPAGILTETVKADWKSTCTRVAKQKVERAEKATIDRARPGEPVGACGPQTDWENQGPGSSGRARPAWILEERIEELDKVQDERWTALLGSWIMSSGCMRYMHVQRAEPRRLTLAFLHCHSQKGKQRQLPEGFDFAVPATFRTGFSWARHMRALFQC
eukprot:s1888_g8.t1